MFGAVMRALAWFVDGLTEALTFCIDLRRRQNLYRVEIGEGGLVLRAPAGEEIGRWVESAGALALAPPELARRLTAAGIAIDLAIPAAWLFRRALEPVAAESAPYLDAFVRHHIERITPWRVNDVHYRILHAPLAEDASRLGVEVAVVPKRLVQAALDAIEGLRPKGLRLVAASLEGAALMAIPLSDSAALRASMMRRYVVAAIVALGLGLGGAILGLWWEIGLVGDEIAADDALIADRRALVAAAVRRDVGGADAEAALKALRQSRPRAVDMIEALAVALPDAAYLTGLTIDKDRLTVSGVATDASQLVPALETSGRFAAVTSAAATTRLDSGQGDRFHLEMKAKPALKEAAAPGLDAGASKAP